VSVRRFREIKEEEAIEESGSIKLVDRELIPPSQIADRDSVVLEALHKWATEKGLDISQFMFKKIRRLDTSESRTVLDRFFDSLDRRDLDRIQIPLDIIDKLRRSR
jgi:hypothetical protein